MNSFTNTMLTVMLGWLRTLLNAVSGLLTSDSSTVFLDFLRSSWRVIFVVLCIGGFALDKIVYIIRWRPKPSWLRRRKRKKSTRPYQDPYTPPLYDDGSFDLPPDGYQQKDYESPYADPYAADAPYPDDTKTRQYQIQPAQYQPQGAQTQVYQPYATPQYAPDAQAYGGRPAQWDADAQTQGFQPAQWDADAQTQGFQPAQWETDARTQGFQPVQEERQRFAFGMEPSFGSVQNEPAYPYQPDAIRTFAPPQQAQAEIPPEPYAPPAYTAMLDDAFGEELPADGQEQSPYFRPFSDRGGEPYAAAKPRGLGTVAKRARSLFNPEEAYESLTYQDLQPTVDVSKAFHAPVYPEKKPEGDA